MTVFEDIVRCVGEVGKASYGKGQDVSEEVIRFVGYCSSSRTGLGRIHTKSLCTSTPMMTFLGRMLKYQ